jgi:hypothetical protein
LGGARRLTLTFQTRTQKRGIAAFHDGGLRDQSTHLEIRIGAADAQTVDQVGPAAQPGVTHLDAITARLFKAVD